MVVIPFTSPRWGVHLQGGVSYNLLEYTPFCDFFVEDFQDQCVPPVNSLEHP